MLDWAARVFGECTGEWLRARAGGRGAWQQSSVAAVERGSSAGGTLDLGAVTHPNLGSPPPDLSVGFPEAAERLRAARDRIGIRALEVALDRDPTIRERHGEVGMRKLLRDTEIYIDRLALCAASSDSSWAQRWADQVAPLYRRRGIPMDDLINLGEGLRLAVQGYLSPAERVPIEAGVDAAIRSFRWYRRLAGDARKRNKLLHFIYKGA